MLASPADITYFLEISSTLNISRAAERLGITQPSLSMALRRLEGALGAPLLIRLKSGVQLTPAGRVFAQSSKALVGEWNSLKANVLRHSHDLVGRFTLGCHVSVGRYSLSHFLPQLLQRYPQIEIQLVHDLSRKITEQVISHQVDIGIVVNPVSHPDLTIQPLWKDRICFWKTAKGLEDTLIYDPNLHQTQVLLQKIGRSGQKFRRTITSTSLETIADLAHAGAGTAILPARVAALTGTKLCKVPGMPYFEDQICLIYRAEAQRSAASKAILAAIRATDFGG